MAYSPTEGLAGASVNHAKVPVVALASVSPDTKPLIAPLNGGTFPPASAAVFAVAGLTVIPLTRTVARARRTTSAG